MKYPAGLSPEEYAAMEAGYEQGRAEKDGMVWVPITKEEAREQIGVGVHTGLRKGTDAADSHVIWKAIADSETTAWTDAIEFAVEGLEFMGYRLCESKPTTGVND